MAQNLDDLKLVISGSIEGTIKDPDVVLEEAGADRFGGFVVSGSFEGKSQLERQDMLWEALDKNLAGEYRSRIVSLLTMTPDEVPGDDELQEHTG